MKQAGYCVFETALGWCGIAWREGGDSGAPPAVTCLQLPEATAKMTETRMARNSGARKASAPPPRIAEVIEKVRKHLQGEIQDFREDRKSTRLNSSHGYISYAVFCLKKKKKQKKQSTT